MSYRALNACDGVFVNVSRFLARRTSRRSFLARVGMSFVGGFLLPLLPLDRRGAPGTAQAAPFVNTAQTKDDTKCNYWRYCAIGGSMCTCCGGTVDSCPPGTFTPPTGWVGSCVNPDDHETYLVMYRDCCGKENCSRCGCGSSEGEMPIYRPQLSGLVLWCLGTEQMSYHCSHAKIVGKA
jgi:methylamine dehydrogenase light chain